MEEPFEFNDEIFAIALDTNHTTANDWAENTPFTVTGWGSTFVRNYYRSDQIRSDQIRSKHLFKKFPSNESTQMSSEARPECSEVSL
jgi:hypothetical protein